MEPEGSLLRPQKLASGPSPESLEFIPPSVGVGDILRCLQYLDYITSNGEMCDE
jgi:hypothetical protein